MGKPVTPVALGAVPSLSDEERYRKQAEDCRQMAAKAVRPLDKEGVAEVSRGLAKAGR